jgi:hypothetical protein
MPAPERQFELLASPKWSVEVGARSVASFQRAVFLYDEALSTALRFEEPTSGTRALGALGRLVKLLLVDFPIANFFLLVQHEVFGHGARAREDGQSPTFSLSVPFPYRLLLDPRTQIGGFAMFKDTGFLDRDLPATSGGIEAEAHHVHLLAVRALSREGVLHFSEQLSYLVGRSSYAGSFVAGAASRSDGRVGDDVASWGQELMNRFNLFGEETRRAVGARLGWAWATQLLDPMLWLCAKQLFVDYLWRGERWARVPRFELGDVGLLPMVRFHLSPFGAEHIIDLVMMHPRLTIDASVRAVSSGLALSVGAGARIFGLRPVSWLELGASLDVWVQPELLHEFRNAYDGRLRPGVSGMVEVHWRPSTRWGVLAQVGAKTEGIVMAQPTRAGVFGLAGLSFTLDRVEKSEGAPASKWRPLQ